MKSIANFYKVISSYEEIAVVIHKNPDGDAVGSSLALRDLLKYFGKKVKIYSFDELPEMFLVLQDGYLKLMDNPIVEKLIFLVDCADFNLTGLINTDILNKIIFSIDHHNRTKIKKVSKYLIYADKSSTAEIIYNIFQYFNVDIESKTADYLLLGIYSDTGGMLHSNVNEKTLEVVSNLLLYGGKLKLAMSCLKERKKFNRIKLWGYAIERLKFNQKYGILYSVITNLELEKYGCDQNDVSGLVNFINSDKNINVFAVFIQQNNKIKGSMRSENKLIDVGKIAEIFSGGGHKKAAGFVYKIEG
ncbi:MAG: MGPA protein [Berkelbacteria bacterium GW2011_GWA2_35_9]|uniref:MGPA protein n=1 Tax=Berkelbacteria bacterium GW2011_GWA2_35_9 TaxID=1618333 RepID=A0A0G0DIY3_9BACT|nr:MAG: MGPA protein [Berkelbacteria bacterium GW2011_GWA2_35_9]